MGWPRALSSTRSSARIPRNSAGVATLENGRLARRRAEGSCARLVCEPRASTIGLGRPTESNAHPHATDRLAVVHNDIIQNFRELREELERKGATFRSDTDTEVVAHLVAEEMRSGCSPAYAVAVVLLRLGMHPA